MADSLFAAVLLKIINEPDGTELVHKISRKEAEGNLALWNNEANPAQLIRDWNIPTPANQVKRFVVGRPASTDDFIVPFEQLSLDDLKRACQEGGCRLVQGHYRSSKTSHMEQLKLWLDQIGWKHVTISFQIHSTLDSIVSVLRDVYPAIPFGSTFSKAIVMIPRDYQLLILWDEFQQIVNVSENLRSDILLGLQSAIPSSGIVQGCLAFGTYDISFISEDKYENSTVISKCPFHGGKTIYIKRPSKIQLLAVLKEWRQQAVFSHVSDDILEDAVGMCISKDGTGHIGVLSFVGQSLDSSASLTNFSMADWLKVKKNILSEMSSIPNTFQSMVEAARLLFGPIKERFISALLGNETVKLQAANANGQPMPLYDAFTHLASCGVFFMVIEGDRQGILRFTCPLVRQYLISNLIPKAGVPIDSQLFKWDNVKNLFDDLIKRLPSESLRDPNCWKSKKRDSKGMIVDGFPKEKFIQGLLFADLLFSKPSQFSIFMECLPVGKESLDLYLHNGEHFIIELKSNIKLLNRDSSNNTRYLNSCVSQAAKYAVHYGQSRAILLNIGLELDKVAKSYVCKIGTHAIEVVVLQAQYKSKEFLEFDWLESDEAVSL